MDMVATAKATRHRRTPPWFINGKGSCAIVWDWDRTLCRCCGIFTRRLREAVSSDILERFTEFLPEKEIETPPKISLNHLVSSVEDKDPSVFRYKIELNLNALRCKTRKAVLY
mmetsp:Transcript_43195/g.71754  ORF Transcript_43195/g.71754 Transcript_43195/m.71754 type:complete len:113 (+) Transcript_43195:992-1330(+)